MHVFGALLWAASVALAFPAESQYGNHKTIKISPTGTAPVSSKSSPSPFPASYGHQNATNCSSTVTTQLPVKATPIYSESMPTATYLPVVHWDKNTTGYYRLTPKDSQNFYYAEDGIADPSQPAGNAFVTFNFTGPSLALEHSDHITTVDCPSNNSLVINFDTKDAVDYALKTWPRNTTEFTLINYVEGCGAVNERDFFIVSSFKLRENTFSIVATGRTTDCLEAASYMSVQYGHHVPDNSSPVPGNYTSPNNLPTAALGEFFDEDLDDQLGYVDIKNTEFAQYAEALTVGTDGESLDRDSQEGDDFDVDAPDFPDDGWVASDPATFVPPSNLTEANSTDKAPSTTLRRRQMGKKAKRIELKTDIQIDVPSKPKLEQSPFGDAIFLGSFFDDKLKAWCVKCGIKGKFFAQGDLEFDLLRQPVVNRAEVKVESSLELGMQIGLEGSASFSQEFKKPVFTAPITPFFIPAVVSIGPSITVEAKAKLTLDASGQLLVGATLSMPNARAHLDLIDNSKTESSGWDPSFEPVFKASAKIKATAEIGFPIGLALQIAFGPFDVFKLGSVAIIDEPSIEASATISGSVSLPAPNSPPAESPAADPVARSISAPSSALVLRDLMIRDDCDNGIEAEVKFKNRVAFEAQAGGGLLKFNKDLHNFEKSLVKKCFKIGDVNSKRTLPARAVNITLPHPIITDKDNTTLSHSNETLEEINYEYNLPNFYDRIYTDSNGNTYGTSLETSSFDRLTTCNDGNIYLHSVEDLDNEVPGCVDSWVSRENVAVADASGRVMHYYKNTMDLLGVSRLRMSDDDAIPKGSVFVTMDPLNEDEDSTTEDIFVAVDMDGTPFYPILCDIADQASKLFLAADPIKGPEALLNPDLMYTLTGGVVESCDFLPVFGN